LITLVVAMQVKPGKEVLFTRKMADYAAYVRTHDRGCVMYMPHIDVERPNTVVLIEKWADQASLDAHSKSPQMKEAMAQFDQCTEGKPQMHSLNELE
jgi:quinol monooxygenase YgiN